MEKFRVPQRMIDVRVTTRDGQQIEGAFYVPAGGSDDEPRCIAKRLGDAECFLPFAGQEDARLLNKATLVTVHVAGRSEEAVTSEHRVNVRLRLADGTELLGVVPYAMPRERARLVDFLNAAPQFFPLQAREETVLVNRDYVVEVSQLDPVDG